MRTLGSCLKYLIGATAALAVVALTPRPAAADITTSVTPVTTTPTTTAHVIEWDLSSIPDQLDLQAGAISTDTRGEDHNQLWFVSRIAGPSGTTADGQRVYRFNPPESLLKGDARWTSWGLRIDTFVGGLKRIRASHDRRFIFVRSAQYVQRIDTGSCSSATLLTSATCDRVVYTALPQVPPEQMFVSDIATDDRNRVFTTGFTAIGTGADLGFVQMIDPSAAAVFDAATNAWTIKGQRWLSDQGAGQCLSGPVSGFCNAGIDVHPGKQTLVYFVEAGDDGHGFITELNVAKTNPSASSPNLRRWSLARLDPTISEPRVLKIDRSGKIWINTGSGHLVSLDPNTNRMTSHLLPLGPTNDPWGIAPDSDVIGYTGAQTNKVAMMFPKRTPVTITPVPGVAPIQPIDVIVQKERAQVASGSVPGDPKIVKTKVSATPDGIFVEGLINTGTSADPSMFPTSAPSMIPLGITANHAKAQGSFFYTVGAAGDLNSFAKRVGHIRLPMKDKAKFPRDDDDADDGFDRHRNEQWHNSEPDDDDADAVPNGYDSQSRRDNMSEGDAAPVLPAQTAEYKVATTASSLALIAAMQPDVATALIAVDVYNAIGTLVGTSGPMAGLATVTVPAPGAGTFTVRVRNLGAVPVNVTPTFVVREPPLLVP